MSRKPEPSVLMPAVGLPLFLSAFVVGLFGTPIIGMLASVIYLFSLLLFPYYVVQLASIKSNFIRTDARAHAGFYFLIFALTAALLRAADELAAKA